MKINVSLPLYEVLSMLVPGLLVVYTLVPVPQGVVSVAVYLIYAYIVGLLLYRLLEVLISCLSGDCRRVSVKRFFSVVFQRNSHCGILEARRRVCEKNQQSDVSVTIDEDYYEAYYHIMDKPCYAAIRQLEIQVALLRMLSVLMVLFMVMTGFHLCTCVELNFCCDWLNQIVDFDKPCWLIVASIIVYIFILIARYHMQMKIFYLVWEGDLYHTKKVKSFRV